MALGFTPLDSEPEGTEVALATVSFLAVVPLAHYGPLRALVVGGLGFGFLPQNGPDFTERSYLSESGNFGLRLRCRTVRHLRIIAGADYAIHDISWEFVPSNPPDDDLRDIGGKLWVRSFFAGLEFHL
jgi:hypothetical protein